MLKIKTYFDIFNKKLEYSWKELYSRNSYCPQSSYEWNMIWWKHFWNKSRKLFIVTVEENDSIVGIGPFMIEKKVFFKQLKFIGSGLTDFHEILFPPEKRVSVLSLIINYILDEKEYDIINLEQISDNSMLFEALNKNPLFKKRVMIKCPIVNFNSLKWEEYFQKLGRNLRRDWTKKYNRLNREGTLYFTKLKTVQEKKQNLKKLFALHIERCEFENRVSKLDQKSIQEFISEIASEIPEVTIFILYYNNKIASYRLGFSSKGIFYDWNTSYDPELFSYSIGRILIGLIVRDLIENGYKKFNFMRGNYSYKRKWMTNDETWTNCQFLARLSPLKGLIAEKYYLDWKWWLKSKFKKFFEKSLVQKIMVRLRY